MGYTTLAEIARALDTTPQAVSNWKSRDHVPHHIVLKVQKDNSQQQPIVVQAGTAPNNDKEETISLADLLEKIAQQIKIIIFTPFVILFLSFTYHQFLIQPVYESKATFLLQGNSTSSGSIIANTLRLSGSKSRDLSSVELIPDILRSRTFSEKILERKFYTKKYNKTLSLLSILTHGTKEPLFGKDTLISEAMPLLAELIKFEDDPKGSFSILSVISPDPFFSRDLATAALEELEKVNLFFKNQSIREKTKFIENRIQSVQADLEYSEQILKEFREKNRQISSPALMLEQERLSRDVEIQKGIFLTLKQQLELEKIEEVGKSSIFQVLDRPLVPTYGFGSGLIKKMIYSLILGIFLGLFFAFLRTTFNSNDTIERKKIKRIKNFFRKKSKDFFFDRRITGAMGLLFLICAPFYFGHKSSTPIFFGRYSTLLLLINILYLIIIITCFSLFYYSKRKKH